MSQHTFLGAGYGKLEGFIAQAVTGSMSFKGLIYLQSINGITGTYNNWPSTSRMEYHFKHAVSS